MTGRLHTCYSPVRRSPAEQASLFPVAPRLACVRPVASVHPEPGSNSPLFLFQLFVFSFLFGSVDDLLKSVFSPKLRIVFRVPQSLQSCSYLVLPVIFLVYRKYFNVHFIAFSILSGSPAVFLSESECKVNTFFQNSKIQRKKKLAISAHFILNTLKIPFLSYLLKNVYLMF